MVTPQLVLQSVFCMKLPWIAVIPFFILFLPISLLASVDVQKVKIGLDGYVRAERWVPVQFQILNSGPPFLGKLQIHKGQTIFEKSLDVGEAAQKRVELLYYHSAPYETVRYTIIDRKGALIREGNLEPRLLNYRDNLLLVISAGEYNHQFLNGQENPWGGKTFVVYFSPQDLLNEWIAYATADGIALGSISPGQLLP
ncbi:MAG TPA: hypothetical protein VFS84_17750, partial [Candidatus Binatia bacterium]|nr:hypothetical protein [Candidatus Binatia bacterium]